MTTKVTLSSPPVQLQDLDDIQDGYQLTPQEVHHQDFVQQGDTQANVTGKRPPTPPKPKQTHASWKQTRLSKQKETGNGNGYYSRSPEPSQQPNSSSNSSKSGKDKKTPTMKSQAAAYDYDHQQYLYHQQALQAESNKDFLPSYSKKQPSGHMDEYFMIQEQLDRTNRERDYLIEENTQLKYHLQMLQYRVQNVEHIWQAYYAQMIVDDKKHQQRHSWANIPSSTPTQQRQQQQQSKRHQYPYSSSYQPDYFAGPASMPPPPPPPPLPFQLSHFGHIPPPPIIDLSPNRSLPERNNRHFQQQQPEGYPRFRRHRSKSLPRKTSVPDDDHHSNAPYPIEQPMMFPPPMLPLVPNPMMASPFPPPPPPRQAFNRSTMVPSLQSKRYSHLQENNNNSDTEGGHSESELDDDDDDDNNSRRRRQPYKGSPMLPFLPSNPPFYSSSFPPFRYPHHQNSNTSLPHMDSGHPYEEEDNWDQRPLAPPLDRIYNPSNKRTAYHRDEGMMRPDPFVKTAHPAKQPSFYNDHQPAYASPHRHPY
ncbi:hypothetical protein [Absidia glauca]|uniref:Uncharacterized protein n=1 Tax=Absidia glauca TaxID=4829 RepID=A0A163KLZ2_ABSGL|nr:hypothetical protein [Absidia glauca]